MRYWCILKNARAALILLSVEFSFTEDITVFNKKMSLKLCKITDLKKY